MTSAHLGALLNHQWCPNAPEYTVEQSLNVAKPFWGCLSQNLPSLLSTSCSPLLALDPTRPVRRVRVVSPGSEKSVVHFRRSYGSPSLLVSSCSFSSYSSPGSHGLEFFPRSGANSPHMNIKTEIRTKPAGSPPETSEGAQPSLEPASSSEPPGHPENATLPLETPSPLNRLRAKPPQNLSRAQTLLALTNSDRTGTPTLIYSDTSSAPSEPVRSGLSKSDQIRAKKAPSLMNIRKQNVFARFSASEALAVSFSAAIVSRTLSLFFDCPIVDHEKLTSTLPRTLSHLEVGNLQRLFTHSLPNGLGLPNVLPPHQ